MPRSAHPCLPLAAAVAPTVGAHTEHATEPWQRLVPTAARHQLATTPQNSFQMYDDVAIVETFVGETTHRDEDAAAYAKAIDRLWNEAATGEDARRLIVRAAQDLRD
ncbi:Scr1 family TA system antitoxin-like transcriptional regulator [Micromonospora sp. NPDC047707]|uniref:Scr1 family TA system antitoxin-like transcriptional regulator n=1 Tax=Micromonospora sp. NPDC047707 TaxID=3154498 RepID=UPI0034566E97